MTAGGRVPAFAGLNRDPAPAPAPEDGVGRYQPVPAEAGSTVPEAGTSPLAPAGTSLVPEAVPASGTSPLEPGTSPLIPAGPVPLTRAGIAGLLLLSAREWVSRTAEDQRRHRTFWHWLWTISVMPPESLAAHREHLKSRVWLHDYMTGWFRVFCEYENVIYGILAHLMKFMLQNLEKVAERQYRFWLAVLVVACCFVIWLASH